jgi:tetratricopeptide (TPR) repeat protein
MMQAERHHVRGMRYGGEGDHHRAIQEFGKAIHLNPNNAASYFNRGMIYYYQQGNHDQAISDFNVSIEINPNFAEAYSHRGEAHSGKGEYEQAIEDFNRALTLDPNNTLT